ncbi:hypothetical protein BofuT4_uP131130.1 [Botrytis cinerea T4]|uniref:Uncharacterized protein n=1 Tax=Botryotinia fuckeliana (strain T4) TaxID=999810 RepID=G2YQN5_BOTF4|nr:hypothetical protein BofuT4_uP131130.1 [Botrytis cinerea T4]
MAQFHSQEEPVVAIKHKTEGMRVTTERFDYPTQILSKGSIAAVASITSHETISAPSSTNASAGPS